MQQVILNLVMNAAEATQSKGQGKVGIRTNYRPGDDAIRIEITDNGDGIPKDILSKIYDPFFTTKEEGKGVGLGLAVVYGIVESHGGDIEVESVVGQRTLFRVQLPIASEPATMKPLVVAASE
jgi:signal transduction histidine kinase